MHTYSTIIVFCIYLQLGKGLDFNTASVNDVIQSITCGENTCRTIIQGYLDRIARYNPLIQAVIATNPCALNEADELDRLYASTRQLKGILHCIPVIAKDNIDVTGMPTTNGLSAFQAQVPRLDADNVRNMKKHGAIFIGKANMSPFADKEAWGNSETGGLIRNPFGTDYTTYGSSGGNGASGAAALSVLGLGSETGVSINLPSSAGNLFGLRPPVDMVSQNGVMPNSQYQDVIGPMAKRAEDIAIALDAMIDQRGMFSQPMTFQRDGLRGLRFSIFPLFAYETFEVPNTGTYRVDPRIVGLFNNMVANLQRAGAIVTNASVNTATVMPAVLRMFTLDDNACKMNWRNAYFSDPNRFGPESPYHSVQDVVNSRRLPAFYQRIWERVVEQGQNPGNCQNQTAEYMTGRRNFITNLLDPLLNNADIALWPAMPEFPPRLQNDAFQRDWGSTNNPPVNLILAGSWSAYPSLDVPMGFSDPQPGAPDGLPVGAFFIARPNNVATLLRAGYAYQQNFGGTKTPQIVLANPVLGQQQSQRCGFGCSMGNAFNQASNYIQQCYRQFVHYFFK